MRQRVKTWKDNLKAGKFVHSWVGRKHTEESKKKISISRTKYLIENPDQVPYVLNHHAKGPSYPELYFKEWLTKENFRFESEFRFGIYSFDFLINGKVDLEIDGDQHLQEKHKQADTHRDKLSKENGYKVIRILWSKFLKKSDKDKLKYLGDLKSRINKACGL